MLSLQKTFTFFIAFVIFFPLASKEQQRTAAASQETNLAYNWGEVAMSCTANDTEKFKPRPTVTSRFLGLIWTAVFDAWSRYDSAAVPVYLQNVGRRPPSERTLANKEKAISYAIYRTMMKYYFSD